MRANFETGPLYPFCVVPAGGDDIEYLVKNLHTDEDFGRFKTSVEAYDKAESLASQRRAALAASRSEA